MSRELVIVYDTPSLRATHIMSSHNLATLLEYFDRVHVTYWSKDADGAPLIFENGKIQFYPYRGVYNSGYVTGLRYMFWIMRTLWRICDEATADKKLIFMAVMPLWPGLPALIVAKLRRKKIFLRLEAQKVEYLKAEDESRGLAKSITALRVLVLKFVYFLTVPFFNIVIGISKDIINEAKHYGARKTVLIPMPVDIVRFHPRKKEKNEQPLIISVGQIKKRKGFGEVIEAVQLLKKENGLAPRLVIVGEVTNPSDELDLQRFQKMAKGIDVEFTGRVGHEELARLYNRADIFVLASYVETLGLVTMEAMASGLAVIATRTSGSRDLIEDGVDGFLVETRNARAIKDKLAVLLEKLGVRERMGARARKKMEVLMGVVDDNNEKLWGECFL